MVAAHPGLEKCSTAVLLSTAAKCCTSIRAQQNRFGQPNTPATKASGNIGTSFLHPFIKTVMGHFIVTRMRVRTIVIRTHTQSKTLCVGTTTGASVQALGEGLMPVEST